MNPLGPRNRFAFAALLVALVWPAKSAAQTVEKFEVLSVNTVGCNAGQFGLMVRRSNLDGGLYIVRTRVQVGALLYMNEHASISANGDSGWSVFNNFTYGIVPNRGVYPINPNGAMRFDFWLERPKGVVLSTWTLVVDGCDTGAILYNAGVILVDGFELDGTSRWTLTVS